MQALSALLFLYDAVLRRPLPHLELIKATKPRRLPVVMIPEETGSVLGELDGVSWIVCMLLYGAGLRLMECLGLRVKDIDDARNQITVYEGKGNRDRRTMLPAIVKEPLQQYMEQVRLLHAEERAEGFGSVFLPDALAQKYPGAVREWRWQYVFPAGRRSLDPRSGQERRHHLGEETIQRAVRRALMRASIRVTSGVQGCLLIR